VLFDGGFVRRFVACNVSNILPVWAPRKLLDSERRAADLVRVATVHGQHEDLRDRVLFFPSFGKERQPIARRRKLRRAQSFADVGERPLRARGNVHEHELAVVTVFVPVDARHNDDDGLSIRRNLRAGNVDDFLEVAQLYLSSLSA